MNPLDKRSWKLLKATFFVNLSNQQLVLKELRREEGVVECKTDMSVIFGDFGKYHLLKSLCDGNNNELDLSLGVVWYLVPDENHNDDGKHIRYLEQTTSNLARF